MQPLIFLHAFAGLLGTIAFAWVFLELRKPEGQNYALAHIGAVLGLILILISWSMGGFYYVTEYGPNVKPLVRSEATWAHDIGTETKEHIFLFLPFLAFANVLLIDQAFKTKSASALSLARSFSLAIFILGLIVTFEGFIISGAARAALGAGA